MREARPRYLDVPGYFHSFSFGCTSGQTLWGLVHRYSHITALLELLNCIDPFLKMVRASVPTYIEFLITPKQLPLIKTADT